MMKHYYTVRELSQILQGHAEHLPAETCFHKLSTDSRNVHPGDLFFALSGEFTDGHSYIKQALEKGAGGIVASCRKISPELLSCRIPLIAVSDPNKALLELAREYRTRLKAGKVIGITGSNGKTSTKEIAASLCRSLNAKTHATEGNFNNFVGVPLTILSANLAESWWVIEMGTNHFGEIATLSRVVKPDLGLITNIGESHLAFLNSTRGVAREKSGLFAGMAPHSIAAFPVNLLHQDIVRSYAHQYGIRAITYGFQHWDVPDKADFSAELISSSPRQSRFDWLGQTFETSFWNPLLLGNLLGVLTLLHLCQVPLELLREATSALSHTVKGRIQLQEMGTFLLVDDTYNANPTSFRGVIDGLKQTYPAHRLIVVAGAMAELGQESDRLHFQLGRQMRNANVAFLFAFGDNEAHQYMAGWQYEDRRSNNAYWTDDMTALVEAFQSVVQQEDLVLVKGSRSARMERFVQLVQARSI